jgi:hypothetical protein
MGIDGNEGARSAGARVADMIPCAPTALGEQRAWRSVSACNHKRTLAGAVSFHEHQLARRRSARRRPAILDCARGRARHHAASAFARVFGGERIGAGVGPARRSRRSRRRRRIVDRRSSRRLPTFVPTRSGSIIGCIAIGCFSPPRSTCRARFFRRTPASSSPTPSARRWCARRLNTGSMPPRAGA